MLQPPSLILSQRMIVESRIKDLSGRRKGERKKVGKGGGGEKHGLGYGTEKKTVIQRRNNIHFSIYL